MSVDPAAFRHLKVRLPDVEGLPAGSIVEVELDHGRANEMGSELLADWKLLAEALEEGPARALLTWSQRRSAKGTPLFISGADVTERAGWDEERVRNHVRHQRAVLARLRRAPVFHVVVVDGVALGWGTEFLICADYRIAGPGASFGLPETGIGIVPGAGGTSELWALIGVPQALRLGMTGERLDYREAVRIGLCQERVDSLEAGLDRARALMRGAALRSPTAIAAFKRGVLHAVGIDASDRAEVEARAYESCLENGDAAIGRAAFKEITAGQPVAWPARSLRLP